MKKLSEKSYWDSVYQNISTQDKKPISLIAYLKNVLKWITRDYSNYFFWEVLCRKYLPYNKEYQVIEIGCAPGKYLINFHKFFGYVPWGVDYSEKGVLITKENFKKYNLDTERVFHGDFFDTNFQIANKERYNVIFSRGFIEHFDDVKKVIALHGNLVKKGGYLVIMIPNLSGLNEVLAKFLNKSSFNLHNTSIMNKKEFTSLFPESMFINLYCDYVGLFSFGLFNTDKKWKYYVYRILLLIQRPFDLMLRLFIRENSVTLRYTSPYLVCIAQKK